MLLLLFLTVSFTLYGVFSPITEQSLIFKDNAASIYTPAYGKLSQTTPPSFFLSPLLHVF